MPTIGPLQVFWISEKVFQFEIVVLQTGVVSKFGTFCPLVRNWAEIGEFLSIFMEHVQAPTGGMKTTGVPLAVLHP